MLIGLYCELVTSLKATALENCAAISRGHAFTESMHAYATADLGLVCSFYHSKYFLLVR